jgi:hypothetical protein
MMPTVQIDVAAPNPKQAARMVETVKKAIPLLDFLAAEKFQILHVEITKGNRVIVHIANGSKCQWLKSKHGAYNYKRSSSSCGPELTWRCDMHGCRVQWVERGH